MSTVTAPSFLAPSPLTMNKERELEDPDQLNARKPTKASKKNKEVEPDPQLLEAADKCKEAYRALSNANKPWEAYHQLLQAKALYEQLPEGRIKTRKLIYSYEGLVGASLAVRNARRDRMHTCFEYSVYSFMLCITLPCVIGSCCCLAIGKTKWVEDATVISYVNKTNELAKGFIQQISEANSITMSTDKNSVPDQARKDIAYANFQLGYLNERDDNYRPTVCCCLNSGAVTITAASGEALAYYKKAIEWDPEDNEYSAAYNTLDADMKRPVVNVTHTTVVYR